MRIYLSLLFFFCMHSSPLYNAPKPYLTIQNPIILFDLDDVLIERNKLLYAYHLPYLATAKYFLYEWSLSNVHQRLFDFLTTLGQQQYIFSPCFGKQFVKYENKILPNIVCDWMKGLITSSEARLRIKEKLQDLQTTGWFKHQAEYELLARLSSLMFSPKIGLASSCIIEEGVKLLRYCAYLGHKIYVLSNIDSETLELFKQAYPMIFNYVDGIHSSADCHFLKPDTNFFKEFIRQTPVDPRGCIFLDDLSINTLAAETVGMESVVFSKDGISRVLKKFHDLRVRGFEDLEGYTLFTWRASVPSKFSEVSTPEI